MHSNGKVPARFVDRSLVGYAAPTPSAAKALARSRELADGGISNLVLIGPTGVGKTHLAAGVVNEISERLRAEERRLVEEFDAGLTDRRPAVPVLPIWTNVADLIVELRLEMDMPVEERGAAPHVSRMRRSRGLVVLDDLGREKTSDWTAETIYALVNARYEAKLPTLVTTNLTDADLAGSPYWPAISRLAEDGALVVINAPDHRTAR